MDSEVIGKLSEIYGLMSDQESRDVYLARMNWLLTGDYNYLSQVVEKYRPELSGHTYISLHDVLEKIKISPVILYGAGGDAYYYRSFWKRIAPSQLIGFCDTNIQKQESGFLGEKVLSVEEATNYKEAFFLIMSSLYGYEMKYKLLERGVSPDHIIEHIFPPLKVSRDMYFEPSIIKFDQEEVFIDGGSYDLSKPLDLVKLTNVKKIYAFEADPVNYESCLKIKEANDLAQVELLPYGMWSSENEIRFSSTGDSGALISEEGNVVIKTKSLDNVVGETENVTFIKMDIEGAEYEALKGCRKTIQRCKPKLAICIYHKPQDMYELPLLIKEMVPEYKLYMRAYSNREIEMVLYAVI